MIGDCEDMGHRASRLARPVTVDYDVIPESVRRFVTTACLISLADAVPVDAAGVSEFFRAATAARDVGMDEREHFHAQMWLAAYLSARPRRTQ